MLRTILAASLAVAVILFATCAVGWFAITPRTDVVTYDISSGDLIENAGFGTISPDGGAVDASGFARLRRGPIFSADIMIVFTLKTSGSLESTWSNLVARSENGSVSDANIAVARLNSLEKSRILDILEVKSGGDLAVIERLSGLDLDCRFFRSHSQSQLRPSEPRIVAYFPSVSALDAEKLLGVSADVLHAYIAEKAESHVVELRF
jgi:hypothetical protein